MVPPSPILSSTTFTLVVLTCICLILILTPIIMGGGAPNLPESSSMVGGAPNLPESSSMVGGATNLPESSSMGGEAPNLPESSSMGEGLPISPSPPLWGRSSQPPWVFFYGGRGSQVLLSPPLLKYYCYVP